LIKNFDDRLIPNFAETWEAFFVKHFLLLLLWSIF